MTQKERLVELLTGKSIDTAADVNYVADHLLENGVIVPPCKVGDEVYRITSTYFNNPNIKETIDCITAIVKDGYFLFNTRLHGEDIICDSYFETYDIGKTVFLTREEAEQAMKEREKE